MNAAPQSLAALPQIGSPLETGKYAGVLTDKEGQPYLLVLLPDRGSDMTWKAATAWAAGLNATLPNRIEAAMLFQHLRGELRKDWHWTCEEHEDDASCAWYCFFDYGSQFYDHKNYEGAAVSVRRLPLQSFNPLESATQLTAVDIAKLRDVGRSLKLAADTAMLAATTAEEALTATSEAA